MFFQYLSNKKLIRDWPNVVQIIVIKTALFRIGVTRADFKHWGKMSDAREELNRSLSEGRI